ncbi:MAG: type III-B CRISPR module RAMP protein Cmr1 [Puniceicoccaceae bacterium]|nr:MAG: type III-B CRISPR module RAMP protein Cmr1 [Puniceicoccaceae bacterium]
MKLAYRIELLSPLFSRGAYEDVPEIRPASIRGQLHWWFRALLHDANLNKSTEVFRRERALFGSIGAGRNATKDDHASKLVVRVGDLPAGNLSTRLPTLPHKPGQRGTRPGDEAPKAAIPAGQVFTLHLIDRLGGLSPDEESALQRTVEAWLLLGGLGNRSNRGAGSLQCLEDGWPTSEGDYTAKVRSLLQGSAFQAWVLPTPYQDAESARKVCTDTIGGPRNTGRKGDDLKQLRNPLGGVGKELNPAFKRRKPSPLKLRLYRFEEGFRIIAVWDGREAITSNTLQHLHSVIKLLADAGKPLGHQLQQVVPGTG